MGVSFYKRSAFWLPLITMTLIGGLLLLIVLAEASMHHTSVARTKVEWYDIIFPFVNLLNQPVFQGYGILVFPLFLGALLLQFPVYGVILGYANTNRHSRTALLLAVFVIGHLLFAICWMLY